MTMANSYAIVSDTFPSNELGRAFGIESAFISLGALAGPGLGGLILAHLPWGYIFFGLTSRWEFCVLSWN